MAYLCCSLVLLCSGLVLTLLHRFGCMCSLLYMHTPWNAYVIVARATLFRAGACSYMLPQRLSFSLVISFALSCPVFLSVRVRLVKIICRTFSSVALLCVASRMGGEAGPLTPGEDVLVHENDKCLQWAEDIFPTAVDKYAANILFCDNLSHQITEEFKAVLKKSNTTLHLLKGNCTDEIQVIDCGIGKQTKVKMAECCESWLEDDENLDKWVSGKITASECRILLTKWFAEAWEEVGKSTDFERLGHRTGCLMTADGSMDSDIKPHGLTEYSFDDTAVGEGFSNMRVRRITGPTQSLMKIMWLATLTYHVKKLTNDGSCGYLCMKTAQVTSLIQWLYYTRICTYIFMYMYCEITEMYHPNL